MDSTKTCCQCNLTKSLNEFYKQKGGSQGVRGACKRCIGDRKAKVKDKYQAVTKAWYERNREAYRTWQRGYYAKNKDVIHLKRKIKALTLTKAL